MFDEEQLDLFINKMFDNAVRSENSVKESLQSFRTQLATTNMCSSDYLKKIDKLIECSTEILALKEKVPTLTATSVVQPKSEKTTKTKQKQKTLGTYPTSSSCMNSTPSSNRCGASSPSYSDSCGGTSRYTSRC